MKFKKQLVQFNYAGWWIKCCWTEPLVLIVTGILYLYGDCKLVFISLEVLLELRLAFFDDFPFLILFMGIFSGNEDEVTGQLDPVFLVLASFRTNLSADAFLRNSRQLVSLGIALFFMKSPISERAFLFAPLLRACPFYT